MEAVLLITIIIIIRIVLGNLSPSIKGEIGEIKAASKLDISLDSTTYKVLNDIYLPTKYGTTQIDHIVVSRYGVFVIETKYYAGKIYGSEYAEYWTQYLPNTENKLYNPIKQNLGHIKAVERIIKDVCLVQPVSIIAIKNSATIKVKSNTAVVGISDLPFEISKYKHIILTDAQVSIIYKLLYNQNITNNEIRKQHSERIKQFVKSKYS